MERGKYHRSTSVSRSYPYVIRDTTEIKSIKFYGILKRQKCNDAV